MLFLLIKFLTSFQEHVIKKIIIIKTGVEGTSKKKKVSHGRVQLSLRKTVQILRQLL
jgi:hypothetical protein